MYFAIIVYDVTWSSIIMYTSHREKYYINTE